MSGQFSVELVENSQPDEPSISTEGAEHPQIPLLRNLSGFNGPKSDEQPKSGHHKKSVFDLDEDEIELSPILFRRPATPKSRSKSKRAAGGKRDEPVTKKTKNQETKQVGEATDKNPEISEQGDDGSGAAGGGGDDESPSKSSSSESEKSKSSQSKNSNSSSSSNSFFDSSTAVPSLASSPVRFQRTATDHEDTTSSVEPASSVSSHSGILSSSSEEEERRRSSSFGGTRVTPVRPSLGPIAGRVSDRSSSSTSGEQTRKRINVHEEHISGSPQLISALTQDDDSDRDIIPPTPTTYQAAPVPSSPTELHAHQKLSSSSPDVLGESEEMIDELDFQKEDQAKNSGNEKKEESSEASFTSSLMSAPGGTQMELESDLSQKRKRKSQRSLVPPSSLEKRHEMELTVRRRSDSEPREEDELQEGELALLLSENRHDQSLASQYEKGEGIMNKETSRSDEEKRAETTSDTSGEVEVVRETPAVEEEEESSRPEPEKRLMMYLRHVVEAKNAEGNWVAIKVLQETSHEFPYSGPSNQDPLPVPVQPKKSGRKRKHQNVNVQRGPSPKQRKPSEGSNRVFAQWTDGYYYPGRIRVVHANHRVSIDYDDGDTAMVDQDRIIHLNLVPVGSELTLCVRRHFRGKAVVLRHTDEPGYFLKKENGTEERWGRSNVCLTSEQADKLREKRGSSSDGSTRSGSSEGGDNGGGGGRSDSSKFGKKFESRETQKRKRGRSREGNASGALPPSTSLFRNILFALTEGEKKDGGEDLRTAEYRSFDKKLIVRQIEAGGGKIVRKITADMGSPSSSKLSLLIASGPCRTLKYMHALALGVPCVSHEFIGDCCTEGRLLDYMDDQYLLPAGFSLEDDGFKAAELRESGPMLNNVTVYVDGGDKFKSFWKTVLPSCGANVFSRLASIPQCDCVVSEGRPSPNLIRQAKKSGVPVVSKEWAIQCVINGQKVPYNADKRYTYNYKQ